MIQFFSDYREANMTQQIDIEKIKAALNAIEELEQIARSTQPADITKHGKRKWIPCWH